MPITRRELKKQFGDDYEELLKSLQEDLLPLGLMIDEFSSEMEGTSKTKPFYYVYFDRDQLMNNAKARLLYLLLTNNTRALSIPSEDDGERADDPRAEWVRSGLSDAERAVLSACLMVAKKFQSDTFPVDELVHLLMPQGDKSIMSMTQFQQALTSLKKKQYLTRSPQQNTVRIGWRTVVEVAAIRSSEDARDDFDDLLENPILDTNAGEEH